jgi:hypothetical protein
LAIALIAFGLAGSTIGNGLVATFVAALALGAAREELPDAFTHFNAGRALGRAPHGRAPLNDRHA